MTAPDTGAAGPCEDKIIRSATTAFKKPAALRAALAVEAHAGWELLEKFDDARVRLRRHVRWREQDAELPQDPYRTWVGISEGTLTLWIVLGTFLGVPVVIGLVLGLVFLISRLAH